MGRFGEAPEGPSNRQRQADVEKDYEKKERKQKLVFICIAQASGVFEAAGTILDRPTTIYLTQRIAPVGLLKMQC